MTKFEQGFQAAIDCLHVKVLDIAGEISSVDDSDEVEVAESFSSCALYLEDKLSTLKLDEQDGAVVILDIQIQG